MTSKSSSTVHEESTKYVVVAIDGGLDLGVRNSELILKLFPYFSLFSIFNLAIFNNFLTFYLNIGRERV